MREKLETLQAGVRQGHALFDALAREWVADYTGRGGKIHCGKGCSGCCTLAVGCVYSEVLRVAAALTPPQRERLTEHVGRLVEETAHAADLPAFLRLRRALGPCPFLEEDGSCGVYAARPYSCRSLHSTAESRWCSADFTLIPQEEKERYLAGLDRSVAAFPVHYVAHLQETAREMEEEAAGAMKRLLGFSLSGNLPLLVQLAEDGLTAAVAESHGTTRDFLSTRGISKPWLATLEKAPPPRRR